VDRVGTLTHDDLVGAWWRMVRRVVLGDAAADDHTVTDLLAELREAANWAWAHPRMEQTRDAFHDRLATHIAAAEPGSLASLVATEPGAAGIEREQQVPQWLFAFDAAVIAVTRALALVATHPAAEAQIRAELDGVDLRSAADLGATRSLVLESLRLWPTTPAILREATEDIELRGVRVPAGTELVIFAPFFHRDAHELPEADQLALHLWSGDAPTRDWPLVPFSDGPGVCAGRNLVLLLASAVVGRLLQRLDLALEPEGLLGPDHPLPGTLSPFPLRLVRR
jgi:cytochrome P450